MLKVQQVILRCQGRITARIMEVKKQRFREGKERGQGHPAPGWKRWDSNPHPLGLCSPATVLLLLWHHAAPLPISFGISLSLSNSLSLSLIHTHFPSAWKCPLLKWNTWKVHVGFLFPAPLTAVPGCSCCSWGHSASNAKRLFFFHSSKHVSIHLWVCAFVYLMSPNDWRRRPRYCVNPSQAMAFQQRTLPTPTSALNTGLHWAQMQGWRKEGVFEVRLGGERVRA